MLLTGRPVPAYDVTPDAQLPHLSGLLKVVDAWLALDSSY